MYLRGSDRLIQLAPVNPVPRPDYYTDPENSIMLYDSERTLSSIRRIAKKISPEVFGARLAQAISERLSNWESRRITGIRGTLTDLTYVEKQLDFPQLPELPEPDRKSTRLNSSHVD